MKTFNLTEDAIKFLDQDFSVPQEVVDIRETVFKENDPCEIDIDDKPYAVVLPWSDYHALITELEYLDSVSRYAE